MEGLGCKLLLTPWRLLENPEKQTVDTVTASHKILTLQALASSLNNSTAKGGRLSRGKALSHLQQSVPQNDRLHLFGIDLWGRPQLVGTFYPKFSHFPQFYSKKLGNMPRKNPTNLWVFLGLSKFFLLSSFCLFCLSFSFLSLCFSTS